MVILRGEIYVAELGLPVGSSPGFRRPVLVIQSDHFNASKINTVIVAVITSNLGVSDAPGNVFLGRADSGLKKDSVLNVSQVITVDKSQLAERIGKIRPSILKDVEEGLRLVLKL
ncbi:MAG: type II toxin-antitoxin system PemK/MazF family toxin [Spirochaetia bacterium]|nr:type II toxin-antitoxin system PemK/MazF family toxin [Spirochaetia bacterium]